MAVIIGILFLAAFFSLMAILSARNRNRLKANGYNLSDMLKGLYYINGHPILNKSAVVNIGFKDRTIFFFGFTGRQIAVITGRSIKSIIVDSETSLQERISLSCPSLSMLAVYPSGKSHKREHAYLTINWQNGGYDHATLFKFTGSDALLKADTIRHKIIKNLS